MISQQAIQRILGIEEKVHLTAIEMAKQLNVTFYPMRERASEQTIAFAERLRKSLNNLGVHTVPFELAWEHVSVSKRLDRFFRYSLNDAIWITRKLFWLPEVSFFLPLDTIFRLSGGRRIKKGICVICVGEQDADELPMQYISSFKTNSIITILDFPRNISERSGFNVHFDEAMSLFAYHMTNIVLAVDQSKWMVYNFNASHPIYSIADKNFDIRVLNSIIPKIVAPISPHKFSEFIIKNDRFDISDDRHSYVIKEMVEGALIFDHTGLYPNGKKIDELPFRRNLHRLIGKLHLDNRSGMSFGFITFQMPTRLFPVISFDDFKKKYSDAFSEVDYFVSSSSEIFVLVEINDKKIVLRVPEVWVMTLKSGANKTHFDPRMDVLKIGLVNGHMSMQFPNGLEINHDYKPSFDTKVILAHAVGNALMAQVYKYLGMNDKFTKSIEFVGMAISHWHGYFNEKLVPSGLFIYGRDNPHVSCSSPQSAIYALRGKLNTFFDRIITTKEKIYIGDVHIEPHHGINISYPSLVELASYILDNPNTTELGNRYL